MTEPTIDEMLEWLDQTVAYKPMGYPSGHSGEPYEDEPEAKAIRAILEQHKTNQAKLDCIVDFMGKVNLGQVRLEAIRAFVERVEHRWRTDGDVDYLFRQYVMAELAAMECHPQRSRDDPELQYRMGGEFGKAND